MEVRGKENRMSNKIENKRSKRNDHKPKPERSASLPEKYRKEGCLYIDGLITNSAHGIYMVELDNGMVASCSARRMEHLRVSNLDGDKVTVEIPTASLEPNPESQKGRIVWRTK